MQKNSSFVVEIIILMVAVIWGVNTPIMKLGLYDVPPMPYNTVRMVVATLVAWIALGCQVRIGRLLREIFVNYVK